MSRKQFGSIFKALALTWILGMSNAGLAQPQVTATGQMSGRVTKEGKPAMGVWVTLRQIKSNGAEKSIPSATTDAEGRFHLKGIAPGTYTLEVLTDVWVYADGNGQFNRLTTTYLYEAGEHVEGVEIRLTRGGVITGRVKDAKQRPVIGMPVRVCYARKNDNVESEKNDQFCAMARLGQTDDRGEYRIYGIPTGQYTVLAGGDWYSFQEGTPTYPSTYYPSSRKVSKATVINVAGEENGNIDIQLAERTAEERKEGENFLLSGRVVDAQTGKGVAGLEVTFVKRLDQGGTQGTAFVAVTNAEGQFAFNQVPRGSLALYVQRSEVGGTHNGYTDYLWVEVNSDVSGVELSYVKGAVIEGLVEVQGISLDSWVKEYQPSLMMQQTIKSVEDWQKFLPEGLSASIGSNGRFRLTGLRPGKYWSSFSIQSQRPFSILKFERDGQPLLHGELQISQGETEIKIRIVCLFGDSNLSGRVMTADGALPAGIGLNVTAQAIQSQSQMTNPFMAQIIQNDRFRFENLPAGEYEINVNAYRQIEILGPTVPAFEPLKTKITIGQGNAADLTLTLQPLKERAIK